MQEITVEELKARMAKGDKLNIIDVRETWEYDEDNIGAKLMPLGELPKFIGDIEDLKNEEIIVHCRSGARSAKAQKYLTSQGFQDVINLAGGIMAYRDSE